MAVLLGIALVVVSVVLNGVAVSVLWHWFAVPLGVPPIETAHAIGLALLAGLLTKRTDGADDNGKGNTAEGAAMRVAMLLVVPLFSIFMGWIVHGIAF